MKTTSRFSTLSTLLLLGMFLISSGAIQAAFLRNVPIELKQPDGTIVKAYATGDEFRRIIHDAEGYTILRHPETSYLVYARLEGAIVVPSEYPVGSIKPALLGIPPNLVPPFPKDKTISNFLNAHSDSDPISAPKIGTINNLVIFVCFSDEAGFGQYIYDYDSLFNNPTSGANSSRNYFQEASYNQLSVANELAPENWTAR